ncbi:MAG TPA: PA2778 family cysteine peptidase [Gallionellaceae bacterium]|nr:PA2778 family cysteine peptidase [Gallionellaceae bacterium]
MLPLACARPIAGVFILLLAACSTPQSKALRSVAPANLPARSELSSVAYFPQDENQCGPASLAMVFHSAGLDVEPGQLKDSLYLPDKQGSLQVEMLATTRRHGLLAYLLQPELQQLLTEVAAGNPVVVLQNLGLSWYQVWHYAVVIGYDMEKEEIFLRSGPDQRLILPFTTFEHTWARSQYWAMVALPPARIPQTATPENYIQSIAALQHSSSNTDTWPAYNAAMLRWPGSLLVTIAAGNQAYNRGDLSVAEQMFFKATQQHPDSAAAFNNLAQTLSDQGKHDAALEAARRALEIGGPLLSVVRQTLSEIGQKKRAAQEGALK